MEHPLSSNRHLISTTKQWSPRFTLALLLAYFGLFGATIGAQGVLWADVINALMLSKTVFGSVQLVSPLVSVCIMLNSGQLDRWLGKKRMALIGLMLLAIAQIALGSAPTVDLLVAALLLMGIGNAMLETAMNSATLDWEQATRRPVMNIMHAGFSAGAMLGAFGAGVLLGWGWNYSQVLILLTGVAIILFLITLPITYPPGSIAAYETQPPATGTLRTLFTQPGILVLAFLGLLGIIGDSAANLWSVVYLRELGASALIGGAAFTFFNASMLAGRLFNSMLITRKGTRVSLFVSGFGIALASVLLLLPGGVPIAILSFGLLGLAGAGVVPTVLSAAARCSPGNSGAVTGAIMSTTYIGFIIIPPLTGGIADQFSLLTALVSVGLSGIAIIWLTCYVRRET